MTRLVIFGFLVCMLAVVPLTGWAQDDDDAEELTYSTWQVTRLDEAGDPEPPLDPDAPAQEVLMFELNEGATLLIVWTGSDILYTLQDDGTFSGTELVPRSTYTFTATLEMVDEDTFMSYSVTETERFTSETTIIYERTENEYALYTELERTIVEYSQFTDCLGREGDVGGAWTRSDLLVPIQIGEDTLVWNQLVFEGGADSFINERTQPFGGFENMITQTFTGTEEGFEFSYHAIADGRDDCEMIYESSYAPFDGDFDALYARAEALVEAEIEEE